MFTNKRRLAFYAFDLAIDDTTNGKSNRGTNGEEPHPKLEREELPADLEHSETGYPEVYLFHRFADDNTGWLQLGEITFSQKETAWCSLIHAPNEYRVRDGAQLDLLAYGNR